MPIRKFSPIELESTINIFQVNEDIEVFDGHLALLVDHLLNHIKVLVAILHLPGGKNLKEALERHPLLKKEATDIRSPQRILMADCIRLLDSLVEVAHLSSYPENSKLVARELEDLQKTIPFLDYRYEDDPFPSDSERE